MQHTARTILRELDRMCEHAHGFKSRSLTSPIGNDGPCEIEVEILGEGRKVVFRTVGEEPHLMLDGYGFHVLEVQHVRMPGEPKGDPEAVRRASVVIEDGELLKWSAPDGMSIVVDDTEYMATAAMRSR